jgi:lipopolysaccharide transport system ATP-binding protein
MKVRLAFAVAAHLDPEILIVDEVLAVGDFEFQQKCLGKMREIANRKSKTVVFVSHNIAALKSLCTTAIYISSGRLVKKGDVSELSTLYMTGRGINHNGIIYTDKQPIRAPENLWIHRIAFRDEENIVCSKMFSSQALYVDIDISPKRDIRNPRIAIAFGDENGNRIFTVANYFHEMENKTYDRDFRLTCLIKKLTLGPGRYSVSVSISELHTGLIDSLDDIAWIDVEWDNVYENAERHYPVYGPVLIEHSWKEFSI